MTLASRLLLAVGAAQLLTGIAPAQQGEPANQLPGRPELDAAQPANFPTTSIFQAVGLSHLDGTLVGGGPDYQTRFEPKGVTFTPALPTAERLYPLTMSVTGYGRGEPELAVGPAKISDEGFTANYKRAGFVESYEHRQGGLKQSFTFTQLPGGSGDLVVSMKVDTDLQVAGQSADGGLNFLHGNMGVSIGAVVGIDANGARVTGSMAYTNGSIEMRLPATFVNNAALPLVLDPLVGPIFPATTTFDDADLDVAYDLTNNVYLATWRRRFSTTSYGIRGQRIDDAGGLIGGYFGINTSTVFPAPRVANVGTEDAFLVVWAESGNILGRSVLASTGVVSALTTILDTADSLGTPDVGGESAIDNEAIVVWENFTNNTIEAKQVNVDGDVSPPTVTPFAAVAEIGDSIATYTNSAPRISNSGGTTGHHCIVWSRQFTSAPETTVRAAIINRNLGILDDFLALTNSSDGDSDLPSVDGDGRNWVVAWENEAVSASGDNNIQARAIGWNANGAAPNQGYLATGIVDVDVGINDDERATNVTWMGDSVLILYEDETATNNDYDVYVQPVDLFTCLDCDPRWFVDGTGGDQGPIRAASKATGGGTADDALIVWSERNLVTANDNKGFARRYRADDGISTNLGGGCGTAGASYAGCAMAGNSNFRARLRGSLPAATTFWLVSPSRFDFSCGPCTMVPDPWSGWTVSATTDAFGDAFIPIAIPSGAALVGATFIHQWITLDAATPACTNLGADLSNALETEIQ